MSSCLSGGGRTAYGIELDIIKSPSSSIRTSHSSSPSSTISESSNSPYSISTRKPRTPRKRPNQTYNEAAALLSTAYPNVFSVNDFSKPCKFIKPHEYSSFSFEESSDDLLLPFPVEKPAFEIDSTAYEKPCPIDSDENGCLTNSSNLCDGYNDFDAESILDEEIEEGVIDGIMGNLDGCLEEEPNAQNNSSCDISAPIDFCYGYPIGLGFGLGGRFDFGFGMMRGAVAKAFRQNDEGDWWRFPVVDVGEISPRLNKVFSPEKRKKKKKKVEKLYAALPSSAQSKDSSVPDSKPSSALSKEDSLPTTKSSSTSNKEDSNPAPKSYPEKFLKLNYDNVLDAWSGKGSPFSDDFPGSEFDGSDALARLAQIDLFGENGAFREASVQRYKEKRRTRLFSKKIRYQVRKVNADQRPRMKGRFVRRLNSSGSGER